MKKIFFLLATVLTVSQTVNSQTIDASLKNGTKSLNTHEKSIKNDKKQSRRELRELNGNEVNSKVAFRFSKDFPGATATQWERLDNFDEASFSMDGQWTSAFYDDKPELVGTTVVKVFSDLPIKAQKILTEKYKDYKVGDILFFDDNEQNETDMILYNQQFEDKDSYFVELSQKNKKILVQVSMDGDVSYFTRLR